MTKPRAPLTIDAALARIAGQLAGGWKDIAAEVDRHESTVRAWGDDDKPEQIPLPSAIALDVAFQRSGGIGHPLLDVYALQLKVAEQAAFPDKIDNAESACVVVRESGDAVQALIRASLPSATPADEDAAIKELEELTAAATEPLTRLAARRSNRAKPP